MKENHENNHRKGNMLHSFDSCIGDRAPIRMCLCVILPGPTGVFSVVITVSKKTGAEYSSLLLPANGGYADTEFRIADGSLQLFISVYGPGTDKVIREKYHAVTVRDGGLVIEGFPDRCGPFVCRTGAAVDAPIRHMI
jgi:hypothetical protein